ncbi:MAG: flagellar hook protein [Desulfonatronovibrio sp. MSAO_Bac4]|nr:MAG: flagellar hook protein [Desulfonatronovibrio sp. MSAO_Bac4]
MPELTEDLVSGSIHFTGLGSGTDFNEMIDQLVQIEQRRVARLELWKSEWDEKVEAFQELNTAMVNLRSELTSMDSVNKFFAKSTSSSNNAVLTASANSDAAEGSYNIEVGGLAQNHIMFSDEGFDSRDSVVNPDGGNIFSYTYDGKKVDLEIPDNATLNNFVNAFNSDPNNRGVRAAIVNQGDKYFLQLRGMDQGKDKDITINSDTNINTFFNGDAQFTVSQQAQNSKIKVDGWPADDNWIERSSNSISDVIEGVTFNLYNEGSSQIVVENNQEEIKDQVYSFVDQVNEVLTIINGQTKVSESGKGSVLTGNYGLQMIQANIKNVMSSIGTGFDRQAGGDVYPSLSTIGITTDAERGSPTFGLLKIDDEELDKALKNDPRAVAELISGDLEPDTTSPDFRYASLVKGTTKAGIYDVRYEVGADGKIVAGSAFIDGKKANIDGNNITAIEGGARGLAIQVDNMTQGEYTGNVRLKSGKVNELRDTLAQLTDSSDGTLKILERNYNDIMRNIDNKIDFEQRRIDRYERNLRMQFARLEELLGYYDGLQTAMGAQINSMLSD